MGVFAFLKNGNLSEPLNCFIFTPEKDLES